MSQMLTALHGQQRSRRRPAAKHTVASALNSKNLRRLFKVLLEGAMPTEQDGLDAVRQCDVDVVALLLKTSDLGRTRYERGFTLLHEVAALNKAQLVPAVIEAINDVQIAWGGKRAVQIGRASSRERVCQYV